MKSISKYIDHTLLKATATEDDIRKLCSEAIAYEFYAVCVNSGYVRLAAEALEGTGVQVCAVVGFPLGAVSSESKLFEAEQAVRDGATEIDMVINLGDLKSNHLDRVEEEIRRIKEVLGDKILKVIIETCYLVPEEVLVASELAVKAGADYVKTSTGFGTAGASLESVRLIRESIMGEARIKASGGIKNLDTALSYLEAGVDRIGTSSGVSIIKELDQ